MLYKNIQFKQFDDEALKLLFNLRLRIEFMCDTRNCAMQVKDPYNLVIISIGNRQTTNNEFTATLGFPNSCNYYEECQVIIFNMLNWDSIGHRTK